MRKKVILLILDGWGHRLDTKNNAVYESNPTNYLNLINTCPHTFLDASEEQVGLPAGQMGNSEVGHTNIGAGRIVYQDFLKISMDVRSGEICNNKNIVNFYKDSLAGSARLHFFGLLSDGGVHSHIDHLKGLVKMANSYGIKDVFVHAFMDGRDTPPKSGIDYMTDLTDFFEKEGQGAIATVTGRYYAMDRDKRWDRVQQAYNVLRFGEGLKSSSAVQAVLDSYSRGETDEFIKPTAIEGVNGEVRDGDFVFFYNFRADRARELCDVFNNSSFNGFERGTQPKVNFMTMTRYEKNHTFPAAYPPVELTEIFGEVISREGLKQLRIAETEKYAHVTYFFNGGRETVFENEIRELVESPKDVATYDEKPEMSVKGVTERFKEVFLNGDIDVTVMNFANPDMVGHTGIEDAAVRACRAVDNALGEVIKIADNTDSVLVVTADHGNCEQMWDYENNQPHTAHTLNPVPLIVYNHKCELKNTRGKLADIAPTILDIMGIKQPEAMTGESLIAR
jgi:2,3-bisphosphoglycerate-independent phosphoglycerate mutase